MKQWKQTKPILSRGKITLFLVVFGIVRGLDLYSTKLNMFKYGYHPEGEVAPVSKWLLSLGGYEALLAGNIIISVLVGFLFWKLRNYRMTQKVMNTILALNLLVVASNFLTFCFI